jgi:hypothetical protein
MNTLLWKEFLVLEVVEVDITVVLVPEVVGKGVEPEWRIKMFNFWVSLIIFTLCNSEKLNWYDNSSVQKD